MNCASSHVKRVPFSGIEAFMARAINPNSVETTIYAFRRKLMLAENGQRVGLEQELMNEFGVSRPTFRQAAQILEQEQLLEIKRGIGGGYFARRPASSSVAHIVSIYLWSRNCSLKDLAKAAASIIIGSVRLAASQTAELRSGLNDFVARERDAVQSPSSLQEFLTSGAEFSKILATLADNLPLSLFLNSIYQFGDSFVHLQQWAEISERVTRSRSLRLIVAESIISGDIALAKENAEKWTDQIAEWMDNEVTAQVLANMDDLLISLNC